MKTEKQTHTPGPWVQPMRYSPEDGRDIPCGAIETTNGATIAVCTYDQAPTVVALNAQLIAAAPDLLAACDDAANYLAGHADMGVRVILVGLRAAIARARGES